jgi:HEAT repeat protein
VIPLIITVVILLVGGGIYYLSRIYCCNLPTENVEDFISKFETEETKKLSNFLEELSNEKDLNLVDSRARELQTINEPGLWPPLVDFILKSQNYVIVSQVQNALGRISSLDSVKALFMIIDDPATEYWQKSNALSVISLGQNPDTTELLYSYTSKISGNRLNKEYTEGTISPDSILESIAGTLVRIGDGESLITLAKIIDEKDIKDMEDNIVQIFINNQSKYGPAVATYLQYNYRLDSKDLFIRQVAIKLIENIKLHLSEDTFNYYLNNYPYLPFKN